MSKNAGERTAVKIEYPFVKIKYPVQIKSNPIVDFWLYSFFLLLMASDNMLIIKIIIENVLNKFM